METQTFKTKGCEITFQDEKIVITDGAKKRFYTTLFTSGLWVFYGVLSVLRYFQKGDEFLLWTGLFIALGHLVVLIINLFRSYRSEFYWHEVNDIELRNRFGNYFLDIKLDGNKIRRVSNIDVFKEELQMYIHRWQQAENIKNGDYKRGTL